MSFRVRPLADLLQLFVGPGVWFAHFVVVYGAEALICRGPGGPRVMLLLGAAATVGALASLAAFALQMRRALVDQNMQGAAFLRGTALALALLAALAVVWTAVPIALLPVCATAGG